jgi:hypothetical protein
MPIHQLGGSHCNESGLVGFFLSKTGEANETHVVINIKPTNKLLRIFEKIIFWQSKVILFLESVKSTPSKTKPLKK